LIGCFPYPLPTYKKCNLEYIVVKRPFENPHVPDLDAEEQLDWCESGVLWETIAAEVRDSYWGKEYHENVKEKGIHPSFVYSHGMEFEDPRYSESHFQVAFRDAPQQIDRKWAEEPNREEVNVVLFQRNKHAV
jgi:hypothetical protein